MGRRDSGEKEAFGAWRSPRDVVEELKRHMLFYRASGGGVTWSGGEAFFSPRNLYRLAYAAAELGIHQAVETSCFFSWSEVHHVVKLLDFFFVDLKHMDNRIHKQYTGVGNENILANLARLGRTGVETVVRVPVVPGVNDDEKNISATAAFIREHMTWKRMELLPYHSLGHVKYAMLDMESSWKEFKVPSKEKMESLRRLIRAEGVEVVSYK